MEKKVFDLGMYVIRLSLIILDEKKRISLDEYF